MVIFPLAPNQTIAQMWSNGAGGGLPMQMTYAAQCRPRHLLCHHSWHCPHYKVLPTVASEAECVKDRCERLSPAEYKSSSRTHSPNEWPDTEAQLHSGSLYLGVSASPSTVPCPTKLICLKQRESWRPETTCGRSWLVQHRVLEPILRTTALALCYSVAEYWCPVWARSSFTHQVDSQLNSSMCLITGCLRSTPVPWLPVLANIAPPGLCRLAATD